MVALPLPLLVNVPVKLILVFDRVITPELVEFKTKLPVPVKAPEKVSPPELEEPNFAPFIVIAPARVPRVVLEFVIAPSVPEAPFPATVMISAPEFNENALVSSVPPLTIVVAAAAVPSGPTVELVDDTPNFKVIPLATETVLVNVLAPPSVKVPVPAVAVVIAVEDPVTITELMLSDTPVARVMVKVAALGEIDVPPLIVQPVVSKVMAAALIEPETVRVPPVP